MKIMSPQIEVELMKMMFWWNASWIDDCPVPWFPRA